MTCHLPDRMFSSKHRRFAGSLAQPETFMEGSGFLLWMVRAFLLTRPKFPYNIASFKSIVREQGFNKQESVASI